MITTESKLWEKLRKKLRPYPILVTRIESSTVRGIPDIAFSTDKINGWIELKIWGSSIDRRFFTVEELLTGMGLTMPQIQWFFTRPYSYIFVKINRHEILLSPNCIYAIVAARYTIDEVCRRFSAEFCPGGRFNGEAILHILKGNSPEIY